MLAFLQWLAVLTVFRGDTQAHKSDLHDGRRLEWYRFKTCDVKSEYKLRVGIVVDERYQKQCGDGCKDKIENLVKQASNAFENNFGFALHIVHILFSKDFNTKSTTFLSTSSCSAAEKKNILGEFNTFRKDSLKDKPAVAIWVLLTPCVEGSGVASKGLMCTTESPVLATLAGAPKQANILAFHLGMSLGASRPEDTNVHGNKYTDGRKYGLMNKHFNYKGETNQFHELHEPNMCDVINHSLGKSKSKKFQARNDAAMKKDSCWDKVANDNSDKSDNSTTPEPTANATTTTTTTTTTTIPTRSSTPAPSAESKSGEGSGDMYTIIIIATVLGALLIMALIFLWIVKRHNRDEKGCMYAYKNMTTGKDP
eukprot:GEMP01056974.1.p1 GENE.GEMP01056974.1~~GEMP01056974.1.p1  ORF type:complete len:368 (+),score=55.19 GEMP01056974.1:264-1367(+)